MKKLCLLILLALSLLLTACGEGRAFKSEYESFSKELASAEAVSFTANVRAEYEHKTARFALSYTGDESGAVVTVLAPELISGISARVSPDGTSLEYGEISLDTGSLDSHGLSPMSALPVMMRALKSGHLDSYWTEDGKTVLRLIPDDEYICTVWFGDEMTPLRAELQSDGRIVVFAQLSDWKLN